jgi:hypothetical protein
MRKVNVIFAVDQTTAQTIRQAFKQYRQDGTLPFGLTESQMRKLRSLSQADLFKSPVIGGTTYHVLVWRIPDIPVDKDDPSAGLKWLEFILDKWPNKFHLINVTGRDGARYGTTLSRVENGVDIVPVKTRIVTPTDTQEVNVEATIANGVLTYKTVTVDVITYEDQGETAEVPHFDIVVNGTPVYPIHAQYMKIFPDDITRNPDGSIASQLPASAPKVVNKVNGWGDPIWI